jgi:hypothetical protein
MVNDRQELRKTRFQEIGLGYSAWKTTSKSSRLTVVKMMS